MYICPKCRTMEESRVISYYDQLKYYFLKSDSDWSDKAKAYRTIAHNFYSEISGNFGTYNDALKDFYKGCKQKEVTGVAYRLKEELNEIVHKNLYVTKEKFVIIYSSLIRLIYLATNVMPDEATLQFIGIGKSSHLDGLNDQQADIVLCDSKLIYVNAGPGTGKTHLLVNKLLQYIGNSKDKEKVVALSYTNTASRELGERFRSKVFSSGLNKEYEFYNGTIHSFCFRMLKSYYASNDKSFDYIIIDENDINDLAEEIMIQLNEKYSKNEIAECLKSRLRTKNPFLREAIREIKEHYSIISIEDILLMFIDELDSTQFVSWIQTMMSVLVIDEAQDLNKQNYDIFSLLLSKIDNLKMLLVGDPRQNIFGFNGGSYKHLDNFLKLHPDHIKKSLSYTYRCPSKVVDYVNTFEYYDCDNISLASMSPIHGEINCRGYEDRVAEASSVISQIRFLNQLSKTAVICSNLKYLRELIDMLIDLGIPYKVFGGKKIVKEHIKHINHVVRVIESDNEYSIRVLAKLNSLKLDNYTGRNIVERFYKSNYGSRLNAVKSNFHRLEQDMHTLFNTIIEEFVSLPSDSTEMHEDYKKLLEISRSYQNPSEYLLGFAIDKETFADFYIKDFRECNIPLGDDYLTISTIHSAKGLEWENVFVMGLAEGEFPNGYWVRDKSDDEKSQFYSDELKKMYVAVTRSKNRLFISYSRTNPWGYKAYPSRFISGL